MTNQVVFGECFEIVESTRKWAYVRLQHDGYEGWLDQKQILPCTEDYFTKYSNTRSHTVTTDLIEIISNPETAEFFPIFLGSVLPFFNEHQVQIGEKRFEFNGETRHSAADRDELVEFAYRYLHAPYLWGGRTPAGIDCSGFVQMVYRICGYSLPRDAKDQAGHGLTLSFIEESEPGDLAFFDNEEGLITHVGIILQDNYILHASGRVRLDRLDQTGIFNPETRSHTHKLRVIKKVL